MASTNHTTYFDLSQYTTNDKPTYLVDYNGDMSKIDAGLHEADSDAKTAISEIGDLANLTTSAKNTVVASINEVDAEADANTTAIGNLSNLTTTANTDLVVAINEVDAEADTNTSNIGTMANLETTNKANLVGAVNEVNSKIANFNLVNFDDLTLSLSSGTLTAGGLKIATNSDGSIAKIYGTLYINRDGNARCRITAPSSLRPESALTINCLVARWATNSVNFGMFDLSIDTDGTITIDMYDAVTNQQITVYALPCLLYIKDFGDTPTPQN